MSTHQPAINSNDRLCFTAFLALMIHALIILGIGFSLHQQANTDPVIEVTLSQQPSQEAPEQADYIAQENQQGAGTLEQAELLTSQQQNPLSDLQPVELPTPVAGQQAASQPVTDPSQVTATLNDDFQIQNLEQPREEPDELSQINEEISLLERSLTMAALDAKQDYQNQLLSRDTRVKRVQSVSALKAEDAYYISQWIDKIHRVGKLNYPEEARRRGIFGSLRMTVVLMADGSVSNIRILRSSGQKVLDDAAVRIVHLASPFAPFPEQLKSDYDMLEITRTWKFSKDGTSSEM